MLGFAPLSSSPLADDGSSVAGLIAGQITTSAPSVDSPTLSQHHSITADSVTAGSPVVDSMGYGNELTALSISPTQPIIDQPDFNQVQALTSVAITTGAVSIDSSTLVENVPLTATAITTGAVAIDNTTITQSHNFKSVISIDAPVVDETRILGFAALSRVDIDGANSIVIGNSVGEVLVEELATSVLA